MLRRSPPPPGTPVGRSGRPVQCFACKEWGHPQRLCPYAQSNAQGNAQGKGVNAVTDATSTPSWSLGNLNDAVSQVKSFFTCDLSQLRTSDSDGFTYLGKGVLPKQRRCPYGTTASRTSGPRYFSSAFKPVAKADKQQPDTSTDDAPTPQEAAGNDTPTTTTATKAILQTTRKTQ